MLLPSATPSSGAQIELGAVALYWLITTNSCPSRSFTLRVGADGRWEASVRRGMTASVKSGYEPGRLRCLSRVSAPVSRLIASA